MSNSPDQDRSEHPTVGEAPANSLHLGSDAAFHEELLSSEEGERASDLAAIRSAMGRGIKQSDAVEMFASEATKVWIIENAGVSLDSPETTP